MTERSIRLPSVERQGAGVIMRPGGRSISWPPQDEGVGEELRRALAHAQDQAVRLGHNHVGPPHLFAGLVAQRSGLAARTLAALGVTQDGARQALESLMGRSESQTDASDITVTPHAQRVLDTARYECRRLAQTITGTEHLLLALLYERERLSTQLMEALGVDPDAARDRTLAQIQVPASYRAAEQATLQVGPYDRFDEASRQVLALAHDEATTLGHSWIGDEHIVLGLARVAESAPPQDALRRLFGAAGLTVERLREEMAKVQPPRPARAAAADLKLTPNVKLVIEVAIREAGAGNVVRPQHIGAALGPAQASMATYLLARFGISPADLQAIRPG